MKREQKSIYVPQYATGVWDAVRAEAEATKQGIGYILLAAFAEKNGLPINPYVSPGELSKQRMKNREA